MQLYGLNHYMLDFVGVLTRMSMVGGSELDSEKIFDFNS